MHARVIFVAYGLEINRDIGATRRNWEIQSEGFFIQHLEGTKRSEEFNLS
jgi:hypothetical protein